MTPASEQLAYVRRFGFGILMIELQYDGVRLATVNARVRSQKFKDPFLVTVSLGGVLALTAEHILRAVFSVIATKVSPAAISAKAM